MNKTNYLAFVAVSLLAVVFAYRRHDFTQPEAWDSFWAPMLITLIGLHLPALLVAGFDYLMNRKFNAGLFNSVNYFVIGFVLLAFFFPNFLKM